ncbi:hypothetical protein QR685DRAFT_136446 [Neurospora intermedia]|uniref:Uncharacterized protein n=1 Tax=Neurospora intermedia TaxID=5142 RepID=A0ABR3CZ00_NEUIN
MVDHGQEPHVADRDQSKCPRVENKSNTPTILHTLKGLGPNKFPSVVKGGVESCSSGQS